MTHKEKAKEIFDKYFTVVDGIDFHDLVKDFEGEKNKLTKQLSCIAVDVILENDCGYNAYDGVDGSELSIDEKYWIEVKNEIENIEA